MPNDFTLPAFLRAIGKGPDEKPEWWCKVGVSKTFSTVDDDACPFADVLIASTPEKDALLLGFGLEWLRGLSSCERWKFGHITYKSMWPSIELERNKGIAFSDSLVEICLSDRPGERLASAIWDAVNGEKQ